MTDVLRSQLTEVVVPYVDGLDPMLLVERPSPGSSWQAHDVQFYETSPFLLDEVQRYIGTGLRLGESAIVIATSTHRHDLEARLAAAGLDLDDARARGQYIALDAAETLAGFMVDGVPDANRFLDTVGRTIAHTTAGGCRVRAFGEMVALLAAAGEFDAAIRLEQLWNDLQATYTFSLLCGYPMEILGGEHVAGAVEQICAEHAHVVPAESYTMLTEPDERLRAITQLQQKGQSLEAEIAERKRAEHALQSLVRISQKLHASLDLDTLLDDLVVESLELVGAESGCAGLRTPEGMVCQKYVRQSEILSLEYCWPPGHGLPGWLLEHKVPYLTNDALRDGQIVHELCLQFGVWSAQHADPGCAGRGARLLRAAQQD